MIALQFAIMLGFPWLSRRISEHYSRISWLSPVVQCYALGIILGNQPFLPLESSWSHRLTEATVVLGIPFLLYATDLPAWIKQARPTLLAFGACVLSAFILSVGVALTLGAEHPNNWQVAGMLVGVYSGGIQNLNAVGLTLGAPEHVFVYLNAADIVCGGVLLLFLTSIAQRVYSWVLPEPVLQKIKSPATKMQSSGSWTWRDQLAAVLLTVFIAGASAALTWLFTGSLENIALLLLLLTALSVASSLHPRVRSWDGSSRTGDYLLLIFCIAIGSLADFSQVWQEGFELLRWTAIVVFGTLLMQILLCRWMKIDYDTVLISATAALYGPVFIGQVASSLRRTDLIFCGISLGLGGYALGNFLGYLTGILVQSLSA
jgi:uncharacterized membrane protein